MRDSFPDGGCRDIQIITFEINRRSTTFQEFANPLFEYFL